MKLQDKNLQDKNASHEIAGHENAGHEIAGQKIENAVFVVIFLNTQHYDALCVNDCL